MLSLLTAEAQLADAEAALSASRAELIDRQINVFLALGGGWQDNTAPKPPVNAAKEGQGQ